MAACAEYAVSEAPMSKDRIWMAFSSFGLAVGLVAGAMGTYCEIEHSAFLKFGLDGAGQSIWHAIACARLVQLPNPPQC